MNGPNLVGLTENEMLNIGGGGGYGCAALGGLTVLAAVSGQWWAVGFALVGAYNAGCFE